MIVEIQTQASINSPTPLRIKIGDGPLPAGNLVLQFASGDAVPTQSLFAQRDGDSLVTMVMSLPENHTSQWRALACEDSCPGITIEKDEGKWTLQLPQGEFGAYHFKDVVRLYISPVLGPGQIPVTRSVPSDRTDDSAIDHKHHRSLFTAYEEANGSSNWNEEEGHGYTRHQKFLDSWEGPVFGGFSAEGLWTDKSGTPVLTETREVRLYNAGEDVRLLDYKVVLTATHGNVEFGDTKEAGLLGMRVNPSMNGSTGGVITNSEDGRGETDCWGQKAAWCDYSGRVEGREVGIAIFDHPHNPNFPTRWHVRDYGLFATNPFSTASFNAGEPTSYILKDKKRVFFHHRILIHRNRADKQKLDAAYHAFGNQNWE